VADVLNWIVTRMRAVAKPLLESFAGTGIEDLAARAAVDTLISTWGKGRLKELLNKELGEVISG
jgi:hypothetical protein